MLSFYLFLLFRCLKCITNIKGLDDLPGDTGHMAAVLDINVISPLI